MRTARVAVCAVALLLFQGCASRSEGTDQTITVETSPTGANCRFYRQATGIVLDQVITPGDVVVEKTEDDMTVECKKEGYETVKANLESEIEGATWGDIILGWAIDYPEFVNLTLVPEFEVIGAPTKLLPTEAPLIWHTIDTNVAAYSEFDGKGRPLQMPPLVDLNLKRLQGEWGRFEYDAKSGARGQGWILMENVEPKL